MPVRYTQSSFTWAAIIPAAVAGSSAPGAGELGAAEPGQEQTLSLQSSESLSPPFFATHTDYQEEGGKHIPQFRLIALAEGG